MVTYTTTPDYYEDARALLAEDDHVEMDINVSGWGHAIRIRSLTAPQRDRINAAAGTGADRDWSVYRAQTLVSGIVRPKLTPAQAAELVEHHNGEPIEELVEAIWSVGSLFQTYARYRDELKALKAAQDQLPQQASE